MENMQEILDSVCYKIERYQNEDYANNEEFRRWIAEITEPQYQFMDNLIDVVAQPITRESKKKRIYLIFIICLEMNPNIFKVLQQSDLLKSTITQYIIETTLEDEIDQNSYKVFIKIFKVEDFMMYIDSRLIKALYDSLNSIDDEEVFEKVIEIIIDINYALSKTESENRKLVLDVHKEHENAQLINEVLLRNLNNDPRKDQMNKIIKFINQALKIQKKIIFSEADFETFVDVCLKKLNEAYNDKKKIKFARVFSKISQFPEFFEYLYKVDEISDALDKCLIKSDNQKLTTLCDNGLYNIEKGLIDVLQKLDESFNEEEFERDEEEEEEEVESD